MFRKLKEKIEDRFAREPKDDLDKMNDALKEQANNQWLNHLNEARKLKDFRKNMDIGINISIRCKRGQMKLIMFFLQEINSIMKVQSQVLEIDEFISNADNQKKLDEVATLLKDLADKIENQQMIKLFELNSIGKKSE